MEGDEDDGSVLEVLDLAGAAGEVEAGEGAEFVVNEKEVVVGAMLHDAEGEADIAAVVNVPACLFEDVFDGV